MTINCPCLVGSIGDPGGLTADPIVPGIYLPGVQTPVLSPDGASIFFSIDGPGYNEANNAKVYEYTMPGLALVGFDTVPDPSPGAANFTTRGICVDAAGDLYWGGYYSDLVSGGTQETRQSVIYRKTGASTWTLVWSDSWLGAPTPGPQNEVEELYSTIIYDPLLDDIYFITVERRDFAPDAQNRVSVARLRGLNAGIIDTLNEPSAGVEPDVLGTWGQGLFMVSPPEGNIWVNVFDGSQWHLRRWTPAFGSYIDVDFVPDVDGGGHVAMPVPDPDGTGDVLIVGTPSGESDALWRINYLGDPIESAGCSAAHAAWTATTPDRSRVQSYLWSSGNNPSEIMDWTLRCGGGAWRIRGAKW